MKYLALGNQLPHLPWAVCKNMSLQDRREIQKILTDLKHSTKGKQILASAKLTGLNIASDSDYDPHREMILSVLNENYCKHGCSNVPTDFNNNSKNPLVIGILPRRSQSKTKLMFQPIANYLQEKLGRKVILKAPKSFEEFWGNIAEKQYDIVHVNQYQYLKSHKLYDYQIILKNVENNSATITPALFVRKDSNIHEIADLKNKHIMFGGDKTAMIAYIAAINLIEKGGLKENDYIGSFAINPMNTCRLVINRQADACAVASHFLDLPEVKNVLDVSQLKILSTGKKMPHLPWAIKGNIDSKLAEEIQIALASLIETPSGKEILNAAALTSLRIAEDKEYNVYRRLIRETLNERY